MALERLLDGNCHHPSPLATSARAQQSSNHWGRALISYIDGRWEKGSLFSDPVKLPCSMRTHWFTSLSSGSPLPSVAPNPWSPGWFLDYNSQDPSPLEFLGVAEQLDDRRLGTSVLPSWLSTVMRSAHLQHGRLP